MSLVSKPIKVTPARPCFYVFAMEYDQIFQTLKMIAADGLHRHFDIELPDVDTESDGER